MTSCRIDDPSCTLPSVERPLRIAEFEHLLSKATATAAVDATTATFSFAPEALTAAAAAELASREVECCSFFSFRLDIGAERLELTVQAPRGHEPLVAALQALGSR